MIYSFRETIHGEELQSNTIGVTAGVLVASSQQVPIKYGIRAAKGMDW